MRFFDASIVEVIEGATPERVRLAALAHTLQEDRDHFTALGPFFRTLASRRQPQGQVQDRAQHRRPDSTRQRFRRRRDVLQELLEQRRRCVLSTATLDSSGIHHRDHV